MELAKSAVTRRIQESLLLSYLLLCATLLNRFTTKISFFTLIFLRLSLSVPQGLRFLPHRNKSVWYESAFVGCCDACDIPSLRMLSGAQTAWQLVWAHANLVTHIRLRRNRTFHYNFSGTGSIQFMVWNEYKLCVRRTVREVQTVLSSRNMTSVAWYLDSQTALIVTETNITL
jgi:hypothetical protein